MNRHHLLPITRPGQYSIHIRHGTATLAPERASKCGEVRIVTNGAQEKTAALSWSTLAYAQLTTNLAARDEETIGVILEAGRNQERLPISWVWITGIRSDL